MGIVLNENSMVIDYSDAIERNKKEKEYLDYINEHIGLVKKAYELYMIPLLDKSNISTMISDDELKNAIRTRITSIDTHDASKFSESEFDGYRAKYYPTIKELNADEDYKEAMERRYAECWKHHYETNDHHPEHYLNHETNVLEDMKLDAIIEMLCDWEAMSLKFNTIPLDWYENDAVDEKKCMTANTKAIVEELLYNVLHNTRK